MDDVTCSKCGAHRPPELAEHPERPPCPHCGGTSLNISASIVESASISDHVEAELVPRDQTRDWKQRWKVVQDELGLLLRPHTEVMSGESIRVSLQRLLSFFTLAYHMKDALKDAATGIGLKPSDVENAVTKDARLALLADLANLDKHMKLTRPPRSGTIPVIERVSGVDNSMGIGWRLLVQIRHRSSIVDGLAIAEDAVSAWQEQLTAWRLG